MTAHYYDNIYTAICSEKTLQSNDKGFFMQFVENVVEKVGEHWVQKVFGRLRIDKERIRIIYEYEPVREVVFYTLSHVQEIYRQKSAEISQSRRLAAEKLFKQGEAQKALALYSQSVLRSPATGENISIDCGVTLALALWGRSSVLLTLQEYNSALVDLQTALKEGLPDSYRAEAFWRMGLCYEKAGMIDKAKVSFSLAEKLLKNNIDQLNVLRMEKRKEYVEVKKNLAKVLPSVSGKTHPNYPNTSAKIAIQQARGFGRFAVARDKIITGATIVVEAPYAACLLPESFGTHCHHCFERLLSPIGCPTCSSVAFCKFDCQTTALNTYHRYECKYLDLLIGSGMSVLAHTALRMITQNGLKRNLDIYDDRSLERAYELCTNSESRKPADFFQRTLMAAFLLRCLQKSGYFPERNGDDCEPTEIELKIGELLLYNLQMLQFNAHEVYETRCAANNRFKGGKSSYIGVAVYPTVALFNHDCYPAVTRYFVGKNIVINAVRPIEPGEMIAENYGPVFTRKNLVERQKSLSSRYWFTCRCLACTQDWPSLDKGLDNVSRKIRCPNKACSNFFTLPVSTETLTCSRCKKTVSLTDSILQLKTCEEQLKMSMNLVEKEEAQKGIQLLIEAIETFHKVSIPPHRDVHLGQELLRIFLADAGNVYQYSLHSNKFQ